MIREAIDVALHDIVLGGDAEDPDALEALLPNAAGVFDAKTASKVLQRLKTCSSAMELYKPTDYHWLLLYDVLKRYCDLFNDTPEAFEIHKAYGITKLDFGALMDDYFWDVDFLTDPEHMLDLTVEQRQELDFSPETFGLTQNLKPHPEELELKVFTGKADEAQIIPALESGSYRRGCEIYPVPPEEPNEERV